MARLQFGLDAFERARGDLPELPVINMFAEAVPTEETGVVLQSRPGLQDRAASMGAGPVQAVIKEDGLLGGALFGVSDGKLFQGTTALDSVTGDGPFSMDGYEDRLFVNGGEVIHVWNGSAMSAVSFPDGADVSKVLVGASRLIAIRKDTETYYWSDVLSSTVGPLSFASAESQPDRLLDALFIDDILVLFGASTVEFHPNTQDALLPFVPLEGRAFERGIKATGCAVKIGATFAWVTDINQVCMSDPDNIISRPGLEALIEESTSTRLWTFVLEGTEFLALRIDAGTWVYSMRSRMWSRMESYGQSNWIPQCFSGGVFGSSIDGRTMAWGAAHLDLGGVLERRIRAGLPITSTGMMVSNTILRTNAGQAPFLTGTYASPVVEMRRSMDLGQTWGNWRQASLGAQGKYRNQAQWTVCGKAGQPGWLAEFRVTDPVPFRVSGVFINEPLGGV
jgi:hypothetical protein